MKKNNISLFISKLKSLNNNINELETIITNEIINNIEIALVDEIKNQLNISDLYGVNEEMINDLGLTITHETNPDGYKIFLYKDKRKIKEIYSYKYKFN